MNADEIYMQHARMLVKISLLTWHSRKAWEQLPESAGVDGLDQALLALVNMPTCGVLGTMLGSV